MAAANQQGIHYNIIDFDIIPDGNPKTLVFIDKSQYMDENGPENPILEVVAPGFALPVSVAIIAGEINVLNSSVMKVTYPGAPYADLADGLYWLTYRICPYDKAYRTKTYLNTTLLEYKFENALLTLDNTPYYKIDDPIIQRKFTEYNICLQTAKASSEIQNNTKAIEYYKLADKIVDSLISTCGTKTNNKLNCSY